MSNPTPTTAGLPTTARLLTGSAFVDPQDPHGPLGNPFAVVFGGDVARWPDAERAAVARQSGTPETVFVTGIGRAVRDDPCGGSEVSVRVLTPTGAELAACAHGFIGALHALAEARVVDPRLPARIRTPTGTARAAYATGGTVTLGFTAAEPRAVPAKGVHLERVFGITTHETLTELPVLSVGSPKLTVALRGDEFERVLARLDGLDYSALLALQRGLGITGVHLFTRDTDTGLPERCVQVNAYLGEALMVDRATGVSCAAQVSADPLIRAGQYVSIRQYARGGPSAVLGLTKGKGRNVTVGGAAVVEDDDPIG